MKKLVLLILFSIPSLLKAQETIIDSTALRLIEAGFVNVRSMEKADYHIFTIDNDSYKIPLEGFSLARHIIEQSDLSKPIVLIGTDRDIPQITMRYDNESMSWSKTTRRLNHFWNEIKNDTKHNSNFGKVDLVFYPNLSFKNYTIYHIYQSLFTICPALEVSLWPGAKFSYQVRIPLFNDGYDESESYIHPGFVTISQKFRDPFNLNILGKFTFGTYNNNVYGASLDLAYHFPNERFWVDGQVALLGKSYYKGFELHYDKMNSFYWNFAVNYYMPILKTQFLIRAQKFLAGDKGLKFEMIRHNKMSSVGLYAEKSIDTRFNVGFRFQFTLSPHHKIRRSNSLKITTGPQMGISYNAGNERVNYKEFRNEAVVNIMSNNYYNPYYLDSYFN